MLNLEFNIHTTTVNNTTLIIMKKQSKEGEGMEGRQAGREGEGE